VRQGAIYENPVTGERMEVLAASAERLEIDFRIAPGGAVPLEHVHPGFSESFEVRRGELSLRIDGRELAAGPGDRHIVEPGVRHAWWNAGEEEAAVILRVSPPGRFGEMIETMFQLARDGETDARGRPHPLQIALTAREFEDTAHLASPPLPLQRALFAPLAPLARLLGKRPTRRYRHAV
jgi:quercetin dioxygenase-like cupin family protein